MAAWCMSWKMNSVGMAVLSAIIALGLTESHGVVLVVEVDSINGNDSECYSLQELQAAHSESNVTESPNARLPANNTPCRTLNRALGNVDCYRSCRYGEINNDSLQNVAVRLYDGVHRLTDCIAIDGGQNVTMEAVNDGQATIECAYLPDSVQVRSQRRDGIQVCRSDGLSFRGVRFERCGPHSPAAVFLNRSSAILFEDCVFA
jgi:hypothetical protein